MAISFVDSWYSGHMNATDDSITMTIPGGAQADDVMIAYCHESNNADQETWDDDGGGGEGWTRIAYDRTTGGRDLETAIYYKFHTGSESNPTFTFGVNQPMSGSMVVYRGVDNFSAPTVSYANATNDGNPPNPEVTVGYDNSWVICIHSQTHDDVTASLEPTGFTMRVDGYLNNTADHMNHFVADISGISAGDYTPPDWQHTVANTTPEYHTYSIALSEAQPIGLTSNFGSQKFSDVNLTITGYGFEASQGSGKVELWSDTSGTIKVTQSIDSWSDTSIQIDLVQGALSDNSYVYLVVINDSADETTWDEFFVGILPYDAFVKTLNPDIYHRFDGDFLDEKGGMSADSNSTVGTWTFPTTPLTKNTTKCWKPDTIDTTIEMSNTDFTNSTGNRTLRYIGGWIQINKVYLTPSTIWEEGGGVNNFYIALGFGNTILFNGRDDGQWAAQSYSDYKLSVDRPYHVMCRFEGSGYGNLFTGYVNGKRVQQDVGETPDITSMVGHSGGWTYNKADKNLDTGGTDIVYTGLESSLFQDWATWSDMGLVDTVMPDSDIRSLFVRGAIPEDILNVDTSANMQTALEAIAPFDYEDVPLGIEVDIPSDGGDLTLDLDDITFDDRVDIHVLWNGESGDTLTLINNGTSNVDENFCEAPFGGSIVIQNPATLTINNVLSGSMIEIYDNEVVDLHNKNTKLAYTNSSGTSFGYSHPGDSNNIIVNIYKDEYEEIKIPFILDSSDQTINIEQIKETN